MTVTEKNRSWVFTIPNFTEESIKAIKAVPCKRIICYSEVAASGLPHLQGAIVFNRPITMTAAKLAIGGKGHLDFMRGRWDQQDYCLKEGREQIRLEDNSRQGQRTDLKRFYDDINRGLDEHDIASKNLRAYCQYQKAYKRLCFIRDKKLTRTFRTVKTVVMWGVGGKGKTRKAYEEGAFLWNPCSPEWWDGYSGEKIICIDEFWGQIPITRLNALLDGYQCRLPMKGGFYWAMWDKVYITSNIDPKDWYPNVPEKVKKALMRRINKVIEYK